METAVIDHDSLARRRSKRSTAGNRMEAALAEIALEESVAEVEDDNDFIGQDDEDEIFDSDFQSTDEEVMQLDDVVGEKEVLEEEKNERRVLRQRAVRATEAAVARQHASFKEPSKTGNIKTKRRVSLGAAVDAETGEVVGFTSKRKSRRQSTMLSSQSLHSRLKDAEERRLAMPKKVKEVAHSYTQAELIARALDTEEGNILEHRNYLSQEEEKRKRAKVIRKTISGPVLRWISRVSDQKVTVEIPARYNYGSYGQYYYAAPGVSGTSSSISHQSNFPKPSSQPPGISSVTNSYLQASQAFPSATFLAVASTKTEERISNVTKNFLVHELDQQDDTPKPEWEDTMSAVFGEHVKWSEVRVYTSKHRPVSRPVYKCPMTGRPAIYRDPRTGVPFANVGAFKTLTQILSHEHIWSEELRCYTTERRDKAISS